MMRDGSVTNLLLEFLVRSYYYIFLNQDINPNSLQNMDTIWRKMKIIICTRPWIFTNPYQATISNLLDHPIVDKEEGSSEGSPHNGNIRTIFSRVTIPLEDEYISQMHRLQGLTP